MIYFHQWEIIIGEFHACVPEMPVLWHAALKIKLITHEIS